MRIIAQKNDKTQIRKIKDLLFEKNTEQHRARYYTNSHHHSIKLRLTQALAFLFRLDLEYDERILNIILKEANQTNVTHINELILGETIESHNLLEIIENVILINTKVKTLFSYKFSFFRSKVTKVSNQCSRYCITCAVKKHQISNLLRNPLIS